MGQGVQRARDRGAGPAPPGPVTAGQVLRGSYMDSVSLMRLTASLEAIQGVRRAAALMDTPANRELLRDSGLWSAALADAGPGDLLLAVCADTEEVARGALDRARALMAATERASGSSIARPRSIHAAARRLGSANLALISVPGPYAAAEADQALALGLHVFLFSDGVALSDEVRLKRRARQVGRFLMGPECGTCIVDGHGLGFANRVRRGRVGLIGASGTGLQEVSTLVHRWGGGISQAIGTGARDLDQTVGGAMTLQALEWLDRDPATAVIVLVSKPPSPAAARAVLAAAASARTPVIACLLGVSGPSQGSLRTVATLAEAAQVAVAVVEGDPAAATERVPVPSSSATRPGRVHGLFTGGTLCEEAASLVGPGGHRFVDFGGREFTAGRPHPMIDPARRNAAVAAAGDDPDAAVLLVDVILGDGAHPDPAGALAPAIREARRRARRRRRTLAVVAHVVGTEDDPQGLAVQEAALRRAGAVVCGSNRDAALLARQLATGEPEGRDG